VRRIHGKPKFAPIAGWCHYPVILHLYPSDAIVNAIRSSHDVQWSVSSLFVECALLADQALQRSNGRAEACFIFPIHRPVCLQTSVAARTQNANPITGCDVDRRFYVMIVID
jgi:hypothetical protein